MYLLFGFGVVERLNASDYNPTQPSKGKKIIDPQVAHIIALQRLWTFNKDQIKKSILKMNF